MIKDHFLEILALDWMIDKPLTTDKKKPNKPIEDKHLTTWCSWRQIRTLLTKFSLCCHKRHTSVKAATCLHKMGRKHNYSLLLRKFIGRKRCRSVPRLLKQRTYMREKRKRTRLVTCFPMFMQSSDSKKSSDWKTIFFSPKVNYFYIIIY